MPRITATKCERGIDARVKNKPARLCRASVGRGARTWNPGARRCHLRRASMMARESIHIRSAAVGRPAPFGLIHNGESGIPKPFQDDLGGGLRVGRSRAGNRRCLAGRPAPHVGAVHDPDSLPAPFLIRVGWAASHSTSAAIARSIRSTFDAAPSQRRALPQDWAADGARVSICNDRLAPLLYRGPVIIQIVRRMVFAFRQVMPLCARNRIFHVQPGPPMIAGPPMPRPPSVLRLWP
jgi:hypothetical protein